MTPSKAIAASGTAGSLPKWMRDLPMETLGELVVPLAMLAIVVALITPLPGFILDLLIVIDILVAIGLTQLAYVAALNQSGGYRLELEALFLFGGLAVALLGAGRLSIGGGRFN